MATTYSDRVAVPEATGSVAEAAGGIAIIVLAIIGLGGVRPDLLASIAVTVLGAALLTGGAAIATEYAQILSGAAVPADATIGSSNGLMAEMFVGGAVLVLGVLCLIGIERATLAGVAVIASGALMLITVPMMLQLAEARRQLMDVPSSAQPLLRASTSSLSGLQLLAGFSAAVLGIVSLAATGTPEAAGAATAGTAAAAMPSLTLTALLILGAALTFNGTALTGSVLRLLHR